MQELVHAVYENTASGSTSLRRLSFGYPLESTEKADHFDGARIKGINSLSGSY
jgi:hypothetical protein